MKFASKCGVVLALALCVCAGNVAEAGRVEGPGVIHTRVEAHDSDSYQVAFRGGRLGEIIVDGDGDTDLDLYVYDENGNLIGSDTDGTDYCVVRFTPNWTGNFRVVVKNLGSVYNAYEMTTN